MKAKESTKKRAHLAEKKEAAFGTVIDLDEYDFEEDSCGTIESLDDLTSSEISAITDIGFDIREDNVIASFIQRNNDDIFVNIITQQRSWHRLRQSLGE
jgi:hypothetical protein